MSRNAVVIAAAALLLAASIGCESRSKLLARLTAEAPAEVTAVSLERNTTTSGQRNRRRRRTSTETDVTYRFEAGGRQYTATASKDGDQTATYRTGMKAKVCYNPSNPDESEVFTAEHVCGR